MSRKRSSSQESFSPSEKEFRIALKKMREMREKLGHEVHPISLKMAMAPPPPPEQEVEFLESSSSEASIESRASSSEVSLGTDVEMALGALEQTLEQTWSKTKRLLPGLKTPTNPPQNLNVIESGPNIGQVEVAGTSGIQRSPTPHNIPTNLNTTKSGPDQMEVAGSNLLPAPSPMSVIILEPCQNQNPPDVEMESPISPSINMEADLNPLDEYLSSSSSSSIHSYQGPCPMVHVGTQTLNRATMENGTQTDHSENLRNHLNASLQVSIKLNIVIKYYRISTRPRIISRSSTTVK